jgi:hypothetical protein
MRGKDGRQHSYIQGALKHDDVVPADVSPGLDFCFYYFGENWYKIEKMEGEGGGSSLTLRLADHGELGALKIHHSLRPRLQTAACHFTSLTNPVPSWRTRDPCFLHLTLNGR